MSLDLRFEQMTDSQGKEAFKILQAEWNLSQPLLNSRFKFFEIAFTAAGTFKVAHALGFQPQDVIHTSTTGAGAITWNFGSFDTTDISVTVTDACTVRAFIGSYRST